MAVLLVTRSDWDHHHHYHGVCAVVDLTPGLALLIKQRIELLEQLRVMKARQLVELRFDAASAEFFDDTPGGIDRGALRLGVPMYPTARPVDMSEKTRLESSTMCVTLSGVSWAARVRAGYTVITAEIPTERLDEYAAP